MENNRNVLQTLKILAPAKLNLSLRLGPKGPAGLHQLVSHMQTISLYDEITISVLDSHLAKLEGSESIQFTCSDPTLPVDRHNLLFEALQVWLEKSGVETNLQVQLVKHIPSQAGLGGGSSDAAAGLLALQRLFPESRLPDSLLRDLAFSLGSDVPFFLTQGLALVSGYGDQVTPLPDLPPTYFVLIKPPLAISTKEAFHAWDAANPQPLALTDQVAADQLQRDEVNLQTQALMGQVVAEVSKKYQREKLDLSLVDYYNDFQPLQAARYPIIQEIIEWLKAWPASQVALSGSGPTVFAAFDGVDRQEACYKALKNHFSHCQVWAVESVPRSIPLS